MYRNNPFHNFEHASHVTMSVVKLLSRIVAPDVTLLSKKDTGSRDMASTLHDHTYGITSDGLTQFSEVHSLVIIYNLNLHNFLTVEQSHLTLTFILSLVQMRFRCLDPRC